MIKLKNHQQKVIDYLINRCYNQRSILLFHFMGTGKTITTLKYLSHFIKKKKFLIVCPDNIIQTWIIEIQKLNLNPKNFQIIDYNEFISTLKNINTHNTFIVLDECHQLCKYLHFDTITNKNTQIKEIYDKINEYEKKLLLSGTPIYEYPSDLCHILNLVSETQSFPTDEKTFLEKYGSPRYPMGISLWAIKLYTNSVVQVPFILITIYLMFTYLYESMYLLHLLQAKNPNTGLSSNEKKQMVRISENQSSSSNTRGGSLIFNKSDFKNINQLIERISQELINNGIKTNSPIIYSMTMYSTKTTLYKFKNFIDKTAVDTEITKEKFYNSIMNDKLYTLYFFQLLLALSSLISLILFFFPSIKNILEFNIKTRRNFYSIDYNMIGNEIGRFISYSPIPDDISNLFPDLSFQTIHHTYDSRQLNMFVNFTDSTLSEEDLILLDVSEDSRFINISRVKVQENITSLKTIGLKIGNVTTHISPDDKIVKINKYEGFKTKRNIGSNNKFEFILNKILNSDPDDKIVIYSNFEAMGTEIFSTFLNLNGIKHYYLDINNSIEERKHILQNFNTTTNAKIRVIILNPAFIEGISLIGVRQFHILEPVDILSKYEQIIARSRRMNSHMHLPEKKRNVTIFNHVCELNFKNKFFDYISIFTKKWFSSNFWKVFINEQNLLSYHKQDITPDSILFNKLYVSRKETEDFIKAISYRSIENISDKDLKKVCKSRK
jgi:hypothetical protein